MRIVTRTFVYQEVVYEDHDYIEFRTGMGETLKGVITNAKDQLDAVIVQPDGWVSGTMSVSKTDIIGIAKPNVEKFRQSLYSAMRSQQEDVIVNGKAHPGLLEPMAEMLLELYNKFQKLFP